MKPKEIVLFYYDKPENFYSDQTKSVIGKVLYKEVILIEDRTDFDREYQKLDICTSYVFVCHVFHSEDKNGIRHQGYREMLSQGIEEDYNIKALLVSSGDSGNVMKNIYDKEHDTRAVYSYNKIHQNIREEKVIIYIKGNEPTDTSQLEESIIFKKDGIFLSHSSEDKEVVEKFRDLILQGGLEYNLDKIKFTSAEDFGIPCGVDIPKHLVSFLNNEMGLFLQFLTPQYISSRVCLNEEGAAWCLISDERMFLSLIVPPYNSSLLPWVKNLDKGINLNNKDSLLNIYQDRKDFFGNDVNTTRFSKKVDEFLLFLASKEGAN